MTSLIVLLSLVNRILRECLIGFAGLNLRIAFVGGLEDCLDKFSWTFVAALISILIVISILAVISASVPRSFVIAS